ncbi:hypothetical protein BDZ91DRAFT_714073 [Kalaharituber pfeilii]|nr:hypothetical protein BDZ91DRAFT_714073 [Kalaharituber pfeilii]
MGLYAVRHSPSLAPETARLNNPCKPSTPRLCRKLAGRQPSRSLRPHCASPIVRL